MRKTLALVLTGAGGVALGLWAYLHRSATPPQPPQAQYADPRVCSNCHGEIVKTYAKTGMGRSFYRLTAETRVEDFAHGTFRHAKSGSEFAMIERGGKFFQRRWQTGFDGKETNIDEKSMDFVIGSGNHARTYLHLTSANTLQVLPLSWYTEKGGYWAMSPGYDHPDYPGSVRPIHYECFFCHNAYPRIPEGDGAEMKFTPPLPEGIDCQRCHGPAQKHVDIASEGGSVEQIRAAIVNPKKLGVDREMEVCLQCHLETTSRSLPHAIRQPDRGPFSYLPGQPLGAFRQEFEPASQTGDFQIAHGGYRLRQSQCFLKSEGKLRCTNCHNPHDIPRGEQAMKGYNAVCVNCHESAIGRAEPAVAHTQGADCVSCHMPKRRTDDVVHVVMTDHYIQRRKPSEDLLAAKTEAPENENTGYRGEVKPYYPAKADELLLAVAQVRDRSNLKDGIPKLDALIRQQKPANAGYYADLGQAHRFNGDPGGSIPYYQEAAQRDPSAFRLAQLGNALMEAQRFPEAETALRRSLALAPNEPIPWGALGWALWQQNRAADARAALEKGIALDSEIPELHNNLGNVLWGSGQQDAAIGEFREALRIQPGVAEWRLNFARVLATKGDLREAAYQFEQSILLKPDLADAHLDYAQLLAGTNRMAEAEKHAAIAVKSAPNSAGAHEMLGSLLGARGQLGQAIAEFETALRLQPDFWRAHFEIGMALGQKGDVEAAVRHLRIAAGGKDPGVAQAARQALQGAGR